MDGGSGILARRLTKGALALSPFTSMQSPTLKVSSWISIESSDCVRPEEVFSISQTSSDTRHDVARLPRHLHRILSCREEAPRIVALAKVTESHNFTCEILFNEWRVTGSTRVGFQLNRSSHRYGTTVVCDVSSEKQDDAFPLRLMKSMTPTTHFDRFIVFPSECALHFEKEGESSDAGNQA